MVVLKKVKVLLKSKKIYFVYLMFQMNQRLLKVILVF
ncbi:unnamed protein product [Trichobilharzia regenti]|nr:unnamed protein product [Trichobilharzia regenti]